MIGNSITRSATELIFAFVVAFLMGGQTDAQGQGDSGHKSATPAVSASLTTVVGCLAGMDGRYTIGTSGDKLYVVEGDPEQLRRFNAVTVKITGTVGLSKHEISQGNALSYQPQTLTVAKIKKIADTCN